MDMIGKYLETLYLQEELLFVNEIDLKTLISKLTPESKTQSLAKKLSKTMNPKKPADSLKKAHSVVKFLPLLKKDRVDKYLTTKVDNYKVLKRTSATIVKNSLPNISDTATEMSSIFLAVSTLFKPKKGPDTSPQKILRDNIKKFVMKVRKFGEDYADEQTDKSKYKKEDIPDIAVAWVIVTSSLALSIAVGTGVFQVLGVLGGILPWVILIITLAWVIGLLGY